MSDPWDGYDSVGGSVPLDLVNTVSWRRDPARRDDRLSDPVRLSEWVVLIGLGEERLEISEEVLEAVKAFRETLYRVLVSDPPDASALRKPLLAAYRHAELAASLPLRWTVPLTDGAALPHRLALAAEELLRSGDLARIRECEGPGCGWIFTDHTRNRSRRWCSSSDCGNRARAKRHYDKGRG
ncbi:CGNR zinc finger domain-containing protein [Amycolatopsis pittospori]|uniref:CGNR zinc finger domain-containing protein n=1 Tax=Amycolatopsis pittospori TaxID=2749434 RepID=UPI0015EFF04C|nr:CGNR zinc finger domain-containing protein [Amycolatopsis pittospori]